jgi:hypothetical protein
LPTGGDSYRRTANYCGAGLRYETAVPHDGRTPLPDAPVVGLPVGFVVVAGTLIVLGDLLILVNLVMLVGGWSVRRIRGCGCPKLGSRCWPAVFQVLPDSGDQRDEVLADAAGCARSARTNSSYKPYVLA